MTELRLADLGEGLRDARIVAWLVRPGDRVAADQPVVLVETEKAAVEIPAPAAGVVGECFGAPGEVVPVVKVRVRRPRAVVDWGRIPLPRGVLSAARRQGFGNPLINQSTRSCTLEGTSVCLPLTSKEPERCERSCGG